MQMQWSNIVVGALLLLFGRRLFWLFVACVGFVMGAQLAVVVLGNTQPEMVVLAVAIGLGVIGAIVSLFLEKLVAGIAGFLAGGYVFYTISLQTQYAAYAWPAALIGGIVGAILIVALLNWALILLSSLLGATVITQNLSLAPAVSRMVFLALLAGGIWIQARQMKPARSKPPLAN